MSLRKLALSVTTGVCMMAIVSLLIFSVTVPDTAYCQSPPPTNPYVYVLVWPYFNYVNAAIDQYKQNLEEDGFSVVIKYRNVYPDPLPTEAEKIKELLQNASKQHELVGAMLVGNVPSAKWEYVDANDYYHNIPCDLYYMDLDGNWTDSGRWMLDGAKAVNWTYNPNEVYDMHTNETGDLEPEIWVGRLYASTVAELFGSTEVELINHYFDKNHRFRSGSLTLPKRGLVYLDDDFADPVSVNEANRSLYEIYGEEPTMVTDTDTTNATDYKNRLNDTLGYEWAYLGIHSRPWEHIFETSEGETYVNSSEIRLIDPRVLFYNTKACKVERYDYEDYISGAYIFADTYGLLTIGIWEYQHEFFERVAQGKCIGQAFLEAVDARGLVMFGHYYFTIIGDPTLRTPRAYNQTRDVAVISLSVADSVYGFTSVHKGWNVTINVTVENHGVFVEKFNVTVYYGNNLLETQTVFVHPEANKNLIFIWGTGENNESYGYYIIKAEASTVPNETDTEDNTMLFSTLRVRITGDVDGDKDVDGGDLHKIQLAMFSRPGEPNWNPNADVDQDHDIDGGDMKKARSHLFEIEQE